MENNVIRDLRQIEQLAVLTRHVLAEVAMDQSRPEMKKDRSVQELMYTGWRTSAWLGGGMLMAALAFGVLVGYIVWGNG